MDRRFASGRGSSPGQAREFNLLSASSGSLPRSGRANEMAFGQTSKLEAFHACSRTELACIRPLVEGIIRPLRVPSPPSWSSKETGGCPPSPSQDHRWLCVSSARGRGAEGDSTATKIPHTPPSKTRRECSSLAAKIGVSTHAPTAVTSGLKLQV